MTHLLFDIVAVFCAFGAGWAFYRWRLKDALPALTRSLHPSYFIFLSLGSISGSYLLGSLNLFVSNTPQFSRSILGAMIGATLFIEVFKAYWGLSRSTGFMYVIPLSVLIMVGRIGCGLSGLEDLTFGSPTSVPWAIDHGDGVLRHPVAFYESINMLVFVAAVILLSRTHACFFILKGFYLFVLFYSAQRFFIEFFKPYATVLLGLNIMQYACLLFSFYAILMLRRTTNESQ